MKSSRFENQRKIEDNIIKYVTNLFRLKKIDDSTIKDVRKIKKRNIYGTFLSMKNIVTNQ